MQAIVTTRETRPERERDTVELGNREVVHIIAPLHYIGRNYKGGSKLGV